MTDYYTGVRNYAVSLPVNTWIGFIIRNKRGLLLTDNETDVRRGKALNTHRKAELEVVMRSIQNDLDRTHSIWTQIEDILSDPSRLLTTKREVLEDIVWEGLRVLRRIVF